MSDPAGKDFPQPSADQVAAGAGNGAANARASRVCVGVITAAHGVRGGVRVKSFTGNPEDIAAYGPLEDEAGHRVALTLTGAGKGTLLATIAGIEDRDRAEAIRGLRLYLPREALPPAEADEYYHADLIGLAAVLADGSPVGTVRAVHDFGAGDTLELSRPGAAPVMVPFTRAIVPVVDILAGRLVLDPPPGLLDAAPAKSLASAEAAPGRAAPDRHDARETG